MGDFIIHLQLQRYVLDCLFDKLTVESYRNNSDIFRIFSHEQTSEFQLTFWRIFNRFCYVCD